MDFGEVLSRAWQIIWKHKVLWIFGILAGCASGGGGSSGNINYTTGEVPTGVERFFSDTPQEVIIMMVIGLIVIALVLIILGIFLSTIGSIGLIRGTLQVEDGAESLAFGELFRGSMPYFWRVFLLNLLIGLAIFAVVMGVILVGVLGAFMTLGLGLICLIPLICLMVPLAWVVGLVIEQSSIAIVVEDLGIMDGLQRGWEVIKTNIGSMAVMWLILTLCIGLVGGLIIGFPMMLVVSPVIIALLAGGDQALTSGLLVTALCFVAYLPILIVLGGILRSYTGSAWTLTFLRLTSPLAPTAEVPEPLPEAST